MPKRDQPINVQISAMVASARPKIEIAKAIRDIFLRDCRDAQDKTIPFFRALGERNNGYFVRIALL